MAHIYNAKLLGASGRPYEVEVHTADTAFNPVGAVYLFMSANHLSFAFPAILYVGKANDLNRRLGEHRQVDGKWGQAIQYGFNALGVISVAKENDRSDIEADLIRNYCPVLNKTGNYLAEILETMLPSRNALAPTPMGAIKRH